MLEDTPHHHQSQYLPILDTEMRVSNGKFEFRHFSKPMASTEIVNSKSAMSLGSKINILVNEGNRRLRNCIPSMEWKYKVPFLNKLMVSMKWSGYSERVRELVSVRILARYNQNLKNFKYEGRPLYRTKEERNSTIKEDKATWFRKNGATATFIVPTTKGSELAKRIREVVTRIPGPKGTSVKVVERPGEPILRNLAPKHPFRMESCMRDRCPFMESDRKCLGKCYRESIV